MLLSDLLTRNRVAIVMAVKVNFLVIKGLGTLLITKDRVEVFTMHLFLSNDEQYNTVTVLLLWIPLIL